MPYIGQGLQQGRRQLFTFTATASQTTFSASYTPGYVDVYQNGILLAPSDYTANNSTSIVLAVGAAVNDEITIIAQHIFSLTDTVSASAGGTFSGDVIMAGNLTVQGSTITVDNATTQTVDLGDNDQVRLGDNNDLLIYHDSTYNNSIIVESGSGNLLLGGTQINFRDSTLNTTMANFNPNGSVDLHHAGTKKFETSSAGIDISGGIVCSPNTAGKDTFELTTNDLDEGRLRIKDVDTTTVQIRAGGDSYFNGGNVGIGTTTPSSKLHIQETASAGTGILLTNNNNTAGTYSDLKFQFSSADSSYASGIRFKQVDTSHGGQIEFYTDNNSGAYTKQMTITEDGHILKPNQPVGYRRNVSTSNTWITLTNNNHNIFSSWYTPAAWQQNSSANTIDDSGRFYAPVAGWYLVNPEIYATTGSSSSPYGYANVYKNGSNQFGGHIINYGGDTNDKMNSHSVIVYMTDTDYVQIGVYVSGSGSFQVYTPYCGYWVYFLG